MKVAYVAAAGMLIFTSGLAVGQRSSPPKFAKYLHPLSIRASDLITLHANVTLLRDNIPMRDISTPGVWYDPKADRVQTSAFINSEFEKQPIAEVKNGSLRKGYSAFLRLQHDVE